MWLCPLFIALGYLTEYIVALYALAVYIDPEEVETLFPGISRRRRRFLNTLVADPRAFVQVLAVYRSFVLILNTTLTILFVQSLHPEGVPIQWYYYPLFMLIVWLLHIIFVEYLPRRTSRTAIDKSMHRHIWIISTIYILFFPVVRMYRHAFKRLNEEQNVTEEQKDDIVERAIETLADQAGIGGSIIEKEEKEMIGSIFMLDQTVVREIMVPRMDIIGIHDTASLKEVQLIVKESGYSRFPVYFKAIDSVIGILYVKDLFSDLPDTNQAFSVRKIMRPSYFVPETKVISELLREFRTEKVHIAIVADEYGGVAGLVTLEDILEEIVGEIQDEHDEEVEEEFVKLTHNTYVLDAGMLIEDLQSQLDTDYDQGDHDTVGGLIYALVGSVPKKGATVNWHDFQFQIDEVVGQRIKRLRLRTT